MASSTEDANTENVFLLQHPLAHAKDPPVVIPTLSRHRQTHHHHVPPTPTSLPCSLSPPGSPILVTTNSPRRHSGTPSTTTTASSATTATTPTTAAATTSNRRKNSAGTPAASMTSTMLHTTAVGGNGSAGLARDLTTRLWQREAELQTMKDLYDAKIKRLTEMLKDAGVSPAEVENNLAVVVEETVVVDDDSDMLHHPHHNFSTDPGHGHTHGHTHSHRRSFMSSHQRQSQRPLFDQLSLHSERSSQRRRNERLFDDDDDDDNNNNNNSNNGDGNDQVEQIDEQEEDMRDNQSECMSSAASILSSCPTQCTQPGWQTTGNKGCSTDTGIGPTAGMGVGTGTDMSKSTNIDGRVDDSSASGRHSMESISTTSTRLYSVSERPFSPTSQMSFDSRSVIDQYSPTTTNTSATTSNWTSSEAKAPQREGPSNPQGSQSPIPSFISESLAAGTIGMKTLREKWAMASGVLSWSRPKSDSHAHTSQHEHQNNSNGSQSTNMVTSPSGLFISREGIVNEKRPPVVEAIIPPLSHHHPHEEDEGEANSDRDTWTGIMVPSNRKQNTKPPRYTGTRPMSDVEFLGSVHGGKYPALTMARDIPRPPINSIQGFLHRPDSYNPSPLHYRAISMAASLIDTGAITPARLYARRTQTMIAKWTIGLIMNSKPPRSTISAFPVIRESLPPELEEEEGKNQGHEQGQEKINKSENRKVKESNSVAQLELNANANYGRSSVPTEIPRALSTFRSHASSNSLMSSSYSSHYNSQQPQSYHHQHHQSVSMNPHSIVELSDISSTPFSMSPSSSYLGECKPLTDRYGFIVNARSMAVQQGLLKLNEVYGADDLESLQGQQQSMPFEYIQTPSDESEKELSSTGVSSTSHPGFHPGSRSGSGSGSGLGLGPSIFYSGYAQTTSPPPSLPTSVTSPVLSTAARPMSTLSSPSSNSAAVTTLLSQIKVMHDSVQMSQKDKWDAFLKKRRRRVHLGEANGNMSSTNLGSPLFGSLSLAAAAAATAAEEELIQDDDDVLYWTSMCLVGIATIGKGSEWEEFRDLVRGGIPVMYRNKIWQETSGAYDMRQPGYYKEILSRQNLEDCQCWSDIEMEEAFWIMASMLERHLPEDYFTQQLLSPQADQRVLKELIQEILPRLHDHFQEMHVDLTAVTFSWFLTLFTDCLPVETLLRVWDVFFVEGMLVLFKVAVAILWMNEKEIVKCRNGAAVYCFMKQMTLSMHQADKLMKVAFVTLKSYVHPDKIEAKRQRHQQNVRQELLQEQQLMKMRSMACVSPPPSQEQQQQQ
ncbi:hypothetical protein BGZ94_000787 [Podila epigama]|nr:hypothetical protein BGZ94_000787 [Podila epigama]